MSLLLIAPSNLRFDKGLVAFSIQQGIQFGQVDGPEFELPGLMGVLVDFSGAVRIAPSTSARAH